MNEVFVKRLKSFAWRLGMMLVAVALDFTAKNLADFEMSPEITVILGLVLGEISKALNSKTA
jgi:hypothetical protein